MTTANNNISTLQTQMTTANNNISTLQTQMTTANNNISTLQTQMNTANTNISTLQGQMTTANNNITTINSTLNTKANSSAPLISSYLYLNNINGVFPITSGAFMALGSNLTAGNAEGNFINTATFLQSSSLMAFNFSKLLTTTTKRDLLQIFNTGNASLLGVLTVNDINTNGNNPITSLNTTLANMTLTDNQMMLQISNNINSINSLNTSVNTLNTNVSNINNTLNTKADIYGYTGCYILDGDISTKGFNKHPVFSSEARFGSFMANSADAIILMPGYQVILYTGINYTGTSQTFTNPNFTSNPAPAFVNLSGTSIGLNTLSSIKVFRWSVAVGNYVEITMTGLS
jgi:chaperonin cofactor prefoldin